IDGLVRFDIRVALAVAVGVDDERHPALRLSGVMRLVEHLRVDPADEAATAAPDRVVSVVVEVQVERAEAGVDDLDLLGLGIVYGVLPAAAPAPAAANRIRLGGGIVRARLAVIRKLRG